MQNLAIRFRYEKIQVSWRIQKTVAQFSWVFVSWQALLFLPHINKNFEIGHILFNLRSSRLPTIASEISQKINQHSLNHKQTDEQPKTVFSLPPSLFSPTVNCSPQQWETFTDSKGVTGMYITSQQKLGFLYKRTSYAQNFWCIKKTQEWTDVVSGRLHTIHITF